MSHAENGQYELDQRLPSEEFKGHGLDNVELQHRNVCKDGFGRVSDVEAGEYTSESSDVHTEASSLSGPSRAVGSNPTCHRNSARSYDQFPPFHS